MFNNVTMESSNSLKKQEGISDYILQENNPTKLYILCTQTRLFITGPNLKPFQKKNTVPYTGTIIWNVLVYYLKKKTRSVTVGN